MQYRSATTDLRTTCLGVLVASMFQYAHSCFPLEDLFLQHRVWTQQTSLHSYNVIKVGVEQEDLTTVERFQNGVKASTEEYRCQIAYGENRYLVRMDGQGMEDSVFQCIQFNVLTPYVIRMGKTDSSYIRKKVNCADDTYTEDESVLVADVSYFTQPCLLTGGYQIIMRPGMAVTSTCLDSTQTYNPRIQFQCDRSRSGNVLIELGDSCELTALTSKVKILKRNIAFFRCFGSWQENQFSSILLQMQENPRQFWCLHYKQHGYANFMQMFITVDGRCSITDFSNEAVPRNTSIFGFVARYIPADDNRCKDKSYMQKCSSVGIDCHDPESTDCPAHCGRCRNEVVFRNCSFDPSTKGDWRDISSKSTNFRISIDSHGISGSLGEFQISAAPGELKCSENAHNKILYRVVQISEDSSCMPYYACVGLAPVAPGLLVFQLQPTARNSETGEPLSCVESNNHWGHVTPTLAERATALFDLSKLTKMRCEHPTQTTFSTVHGACRILLKPCSGDCTTLYAGYDPVTCGNESGLAVKLENQHTCYGSLHFEDGILGVVTKSVSGRYFCWVLTNTRLFITKVDHCHQASISQLMTDPEAENEFDPLNAIAIPMAETESAGLKLLPFNPKYFSIVYLFIFIYKLF